MALSKTIWTEIWNRVMYREELGVKIEVSDGHAAVVQLDRTRPPTARDYKVSHTPNPNIVCILKPGVSLDQDSDPALRKILSDLE